MSAHGVPGAFSSALSILWKGILIILSIFLLSKLFVFLFPDFGQSGIKNKLNTYYEENNNQESVSSKSEYAFNILKPETWTYEAMIARQEEREKNGEIKNNFVKPILVPSIEEWNKKNNPAYKDYTQEVNYIDYNENYDKESYVNIYNTNKDTTQNEWYTDGSMWR